MITTYDRIRYSDNRKGAENMSYKIVGDSSTDLTKELKEQGNIVHVPLILQIDDEEIIDDETFDQADMLQKMKNSKHTLKSACPSPDAFLAHYDDADDIFVITLSGKLSGSYNSAEVAKKMYLEEHPDKNIMVIDSCSASVGQTLIAMRIQELMEQGVGFEETCKKVLQYRDEMCTKFVLESLEVFRRNGRLSSVKAVLVNTLNIKAVMTSNPDGSIEKMDQGRGMKKALEKMVDCIKKDMVNPEEKVLGIAHCNNYERAEFVKSIVLAEIPFKDCIIVDTRGLSSFYANDGGIIVAY